MFKNNQFSLTDIKLIKRIILNKFSIKYVLANYLKIALNKIFTNRNTQ